nr:hypothetical protein [Micromonospora parastrephiae]
MPAGPPGRREHGLEGAEHPADVGAFPVQLGVAAVERREGRRQVTPVHRRHDLPGTTPAVPLGEPPRHGQRAGVLRREDPVAARGAPHGRQHALLDVVAHLLHGDPDGGGQVHGAQAILWLDVHDGNPSG